jgi:hypothetical protein
MARLKRGVGAGRHAQIADFARSPELTAPNRSPVQGATSATPTPSTAVIRYAFPESVSLTAESNTSSVEGDCDALDHRDSVRCRYSRVDSTHDRPNAG